MTTSAAKTHRSIDRPTTPLNADAAKPMARSARSTLSVLLVLALVAGAAIGAALATVEPAAAATGRTEIVINGRGWGHGRGMSQYGALGYAVDHGWSSAEILDHYYGGTTAGAAPSPGAVDPDRVRVDLVHLRNRSTTVALADGTIRLLDQTGATLTTVSGAVRLVVSGSSTTIESGANCNGPWTAELTVPHSLVRVVAEPTAGAADDHNRLLQACGPSYRVWYDGELWATATDGGDRRTLNVVTVEQYLRGVVPNEMPAGWDLRALEVQAVAARSYALAGDTRWQPYADTCDTTRCQVYDGRYTTRGSRFRSSTHPRTDQALASTAGLVRLTESGEVARTEFSSSTGGHTAGGDFPAVVDDGDDVSINPNHRWQRTVDLSGLERSVGKGQVTGLQVLSADGNGDDGGRVLQVEILFERGRITMTGDQLRSSLGLKSNWFRFGRLTRGGEQIVDLARRDSSNRAFIRRAFQRLEGRPPTDAELQRWTEELRDKPKMSFTAELVGGDHFAGVMVDDLYRLALGRSADADGRAYWVDTMGQGLKFEHMGTLFYGSPEYVNRAGGTNVAFVDSLYLNILGRSSDPDGRSYWVGLLERGEAGPADVANAFYRSVESRRDRSSALHLRVLGSQPDADAVEDLAERLKTIDDLALAAELAVSLDENSP